MLGMMIALFLRLPEITHAIAPTLRYSNTPVLQPLHGEGDCLRKRNK